MSLTVADIVHAINISINASTSQADRNISNNIILSLKDSPHYLTILIRLVVETDYDISVKLTCLSIFVESIKCNWDLLALDEQLIIRQIGLTLFTNSIICESSIIRRKTAVAIAQISMRQFPQIWSTYIDDILNYLRSDKLEQQELALLSLLYFVEDSLNSDYNSIISSQRKQEIISGLLNLETVILSCLSKYLEAKLATYSY
eukprot:gene11703-15668_t